MKIASTCIYTIVHTETLDDLAAKGKNLHHEEKKSWATGKQLINEALLKGETMFILFTPAEYCDEVIYFAELQNIVTSTGKPTTFYFRNMIATEEPRPLKKELVVANTGKTVSQKHIRPYIICNTPEWLEEMVEAEHQ